MARNKTNYSPDRQKHVHISRANLKVRSKPGTPQLAFKHYFVRTSNQIFWRHLRLYVAKLQWRIKGPADPAARGGPVVQARSLDVRNTIKSVVCTSGPDSVLPTCQYSGSLLRDLDLTSLIITGRPPIIELRRSTDRLSAPLYNLPPQSALRTATCCNRCDANCGRDKF
jgi:hypothetical protein